MEKMNKLLIASSILLSIGVLIYILEGFILHNSFIYERMTDIERIIYFSQLSKDHYSFCFNDNNFSGLEQTIATLCILIGIQALYDGVKDV